MNNPLINIYASNCGIFPEDTSIPDLKSQDQGTKVFYASDLKSPFQSLLIDPIQPKLDDHEMSTFMKTNKIHLIIRALSNEDSSTPSETLIYLNDNYYIIPEHFILRIFPGQTPISLPVDKSELLQDLKKSYVIDTNTTDEME